MAFTLLSYAYASRIRPNPGKRIDDLNEKSVSVDLIDGLVNPVAKDLTIHATYAGGVPVVHAIEHGGKRQQASLSLLLLVFLPSRRRSAAE